MRCMAALCAAGLRSTSEGGVGVLPSSESSDADEDDGGCSRFAGTADGTCCCGLPRRIGADGASSARWCVTPGDGDLRLAQSEGPACEPRIGSGSSSSPRSRSSCAGRQRGHSGVANHEPRSSRRAQRMSLSASVRAAVASARASVARTHLMAVRVVNEHGPAARANARLGLHVPTHAAVPLIIFCRAILRRLSTAFL